MRSKGWVLGLIAACGMVPASSAFGSAITIYNTGQSTGGTALTAGTADTHYTLISAPAGVPLTAIATAANPAWTPDTASTDWISPGASGNTGWAAGTYDYQTTFSLTGLNAATAQLAGLWSADNTACIYLNGANTGDCLGSSAYGTLTNFSITSGFIAGINKLDFVVVNGDGPTGVYAQVSGTASASAVPEPSSWALALSGVAGAGLLLFRKRDSGSLHGAA